MTEHNYNVITTVTAYQCKVLARNASIDTTIEAQVKNAARPSCKHHNAIAG